MELEAEWTDDCQGKKDYDADLVQLSTRYWPRGGGFFTFDTASGEFGDNDSRPEIKPSAHATILLQDEDIAEFECEGDTEAEVKIKVEAWANEAFAKIEAAIRAAFAKPSDGPA